jgi:hypothetical protein
VTVAIASARLAFGGFSSSSPLVAVRDGMWWRDDFLNGMLSSYATNGTGAQTIGSGPLATRPGIYRGTVSAAATPDRANVGLTVGTAGLAQCQQFVFGGGELAAEIAMSLVATSDGVDNYVLRAGFGDLGTGDMVDGAYFENDRSTYGDNGWRIKTASNSVRTTTNTGIAPVAGVFGRYGIIVNAAATLVTFTIDGVSVGTINTNIPTSAARTLGFIIQLIKTLGAGAKSIEVDYYEITQTFTARR